MMNVKNTELLAQLGQAWGNLQDEQHADNQSFSEYMQTSATGMQGMGGIALQNGGNELGACNQTSATQMGNTSTGHTNAHTVLANGDQDAGHVLGQVFGNLTT